MLDASKTRLRELVDALPESEVEAAKRFLEFLISRKHDPVMQEYGIGE